MKRGVNARGPLAPDVAKQWLMPDDFGNPVPVAARTIFLRRIGGVDRLVDVGVRLEVTEAGMLALTWWRRIGTDFRGRLRAW